jgi:hypothetical protein
MSFVGEIISSYTKVFVFEDSYIDRDLLVDYDELEEEIKKDDSELKEVKKTPIDSLT